MIYLDAAATTLEKPPQVRQAMAQAAAELSTPGRGSHPAARRAEETAFRCRAEAAALFGVPSPENVVFTMNATHGLNIAIRSLVVPGSRVVISGYEHNAVCRPLYAIPEVRLTVVDAPPFRREQAAEEFRRAILAGADAVIVNHVSNVFGCVQPLEEIAGVCRSRGVPLLVDASQSAGTLPLHLTELGAAFIAMPGHKGLYGPQGTGPVSYTHLDVYKRQLDHSGLIALGCFFDGFEIHSIPPLKFYDRDRRIQTNYLPLQHHHTTVPADVKQKFMKPKSFSE